MAKKILIVTLHDYEDAPLSAADPFASLKTEVIRFSTILHFVRFGFRDNVCLPDTAFSNTIDALLALKPSITYHRVYALAVNEDCYNIIHCERNLNFPDDPSWHPSLTELYSKMECVHMLKREDFEIMAVYEHQQNPAKNPICYEHEAFSEVELILSLRQMLEQYLPHTKIKKSASLPYFGLNYPMTAMFSDSVKNTVGKVAPTVARILSFKKSD